MALTEATIETLLNKEIADSSTDRVSAADRLNAITEAVVWLKESLGNDHEINTYTLNYFDTINEYKATTAIADLMEASDLRRASADHIKSPSYKSPRDLAEQIGQQASEFSYTIERRNGNSYIVINHDSKFPTRLVDSFDAITSDGTWTADTTNSDALNITQDTVEFVTGTGSLNFDVDVSQSGNNRSTIYKTLDTAQDLSDVEDLGSWLLRAYIPDVTYVTSYTLYWGTSDSAYWSKTSTTDYGGTALANGWNRLKFDWASSTMTGTPDSSDINYLRIDVNYSASQTDDTDFRYDELTVCRPEPLTLYYTSQNVGTNSSGTALTTFTATTDIPYFSGQYDNYKFPVAHKAAALLYRSNLRLHDEADRQEIEAEKALKRISQMIPASRQPQAKSFKVNGINFNRRTRRR